MELENQSIKKPIKSFLKIGAAAVVTASLLANAVNINHNINSKSIDNIQTSLDGEGFGFKFHKDIALENPLNYYYSDDSIKSDKRLSAYFVKSNPDHYYYLPDALKSDIEFNKQLVAINPKVYEEMDKSMQSKINFDVNVVIYKIEKKFGIIDKESSEKEFIIKDPNDKNFKLPPAPTNVAYEQKVEINYVLSKMQDIRDKNFKAVKEYKKQI